MKRYEPYTLRLTMFKYPKIYRVCASENRELLAFPDDFIYITEKVDGGNMSIFLDENKVLNECSRNRNLTKEHDEKAFIKQRLWLRDTLQHKTIDPDLIYYFEAMQKHTINYTRAPDILGFDIRLRHSSNSEHLGLFLPYPAMVEEFTKLNIPTVPLIWKGSARDLKKLDIKDMIPTSKYYDGLAEGLAIKNYGRMSTVGNHQLFGKIVRKDFQEKNKAVFGGIKQKNTDTNKIVDIYCTDARIKKVILKCTNEENLPLNLTLMNQVPRRVILDILSEEFGNLFTHYKFIDFTQMKRLVGQRCISVLRDMLNAW